MYYVFDLYEKSIEYQDRSSGMGDVIASQDRNPSDSGDNIEMSINYHEREMEISRATAHKLGEVRSYCTLGEDYIVLGQYAKSIDYFEKAVEISQATGNRKAEGNSYNGLGGVYYDLGQYEKSIKYQEKALEICKEKEDRDGERTANTYIGSLHRALGQ